MSSTPSVPLHRLGLPLGLLLMSAGLTAHAMQGERSVLPGENLKPPENRGTGGGPVSGLQIIALKAGRGPYVWVPGGGIVRSFISDTPQTLTIAAEARVKDHPELAGGIQWEITPPPGFEVPAGASLRGGKMSVRLQRPAGNPTGVGSPLTLSVRAKLSSGGKSLSASADVAQDLRDRLRQEYVDLARSYVPDRAELLDQQQYAEKFARKYPGVNFNDLNWTRRPDTDEPYPFIMASEALVRVLRDAEKKYGRPLVISSGFRNPVRQLQVHAAVEESHHQYGRAADLFVTPDSAHPHTGRKTASETDWLLLAAAAVRAGGSWIEPMLDCHVNTEGCHVHVDVRDSGAHSVITQVGGRVLDPAGQPLAGATVHLAGMPAITNSDGRFLLKHVLTPREYNLEIERPGFGAILQPVQIEGEKAQVAVRLPSKPQPTLTARVGGEERGEGRLALRCALKNAGFAEAREIQLTTEEGMQVEPTEAATLAPGKELVFRVPRASAEAASNPVVIATYRTEDGVQRVQHLTLSASTGVGAPVDSRPARPPLKRTPGEMEQDGAAAAGGLAIGGVAAAAQALARKRAQQVKAGSNSVHSPGDASEPPVMVNDSQPVTTK